MIIKANDITQNRLTYQKCDNCKMPNVCYAIKLKDEPLQKPTPPNWYCQKCINKDFHKLNLTCLKTNERQINNKPKFPEPKFNPSCDSPNYTYSPPIPPRPFNSIDGTLNNDTET